jgi:hypothetical protein
VIHDLKGIEPIGAAVKIAIKGPRGFPEQRDRFHIRETHESPGGACVSHPSFGFWNQPPPDAIANGMIQTKSDSYQAFARSRRVIRGVLIGPWGETVWGDLPRSDGMFSQLYRAQVLPGHKPPPGKRPTCSGDGVQARRWSGEKGPSDWRTIPCGGEACPFRQRPPGDKEKAACSPSTSLLFRLSFTPEVMERFRPPTPVVRFSTNAWVSGRGILGLKESMDRAAKDLGLETYNPTGFRFTMTRVERTGAGTRYPAIDVSPDESAHDFLASASRRLLSLQTQVRGITADDHLTIEGA